LKLKFQTVVEKTVKNFRGLLYFAAPGMCPHVCWFLSILVHLELFYLKVWH